MTVWVDRDASGNIIASYFEQQHPGQERVPSLDEAAAQAIDAIDRLQFRHLFNLENRVRIIESRPQVTMEQYRAAMIQLWKDLYS